MIDGTVYDFCYLSKHKFDHNFELIFNPKCSCSLKDKPVSHFFCTAIFDELGKIYIDIVDLSGNEMSQLLLHGDSKYNIMQNSRTINAAFRFRRKFQRFDGPLF